jgi:hypothetical protein
MTDTNTNANADTHADRNADTATNTDTRAAFDAAIDTVEGGYEFLLAYAAQGRRSDRDAGASQGPRPRLEAMVAALTALPACAREIAAEGDRLARGSEFFDAFERDAAVAAAAIGLVLARADIGSQLVDNLNASIHLRAVLTDIFLLDEALRPQA